MPSGTIHLGDNLEVLRREVADSSVDLIYLDPPFKSNRKYAASLEEKGREGKVRVEAFDDAWKWDDRARDAFEEAVNQGGETGKLLAALRDFLGKSDMAAYLAMMAPRLLEMKRTLRPAGSIYLHCDPSAGHYLKLLMDSVFGRENFKNEIVWHYRRWTNAQAGFQRMHDVILFYGGGGKVKFHAPYVDPTESQARVIERGWNVNKVKGPSGKVLQLLIYDEEKANAAAEEGRLDFSRYGRVVRREPRKSAAGDVWTDVQYVHSQARERTGYPTQKPLALLERIVSSSSDPGDLVLDPFLGSGASAAAAHRLGRDWIGIDSSPVAATLAARRLAEQTGSGIAAEPSGWPVRF